MRKIYSCLTIFLVITILSGCNNYLDILPDDKPELEDAFKDKFNAEKYLFTCYNSLPNYVTPTNTLGLSGGGEEGKRSVQGIIRLPYNQRRGGGKYASPFPCTRNTHIYTIL